MSAADRVEAFLESRARSNGLDPDLVHGHNGNDLTVTDLRELVEKARWADALRAKPSVQHGFRRPQSDRRPGEIDERLVAPLHVMRAQDEGNAPKFERDTVISMVTRGVLGPWREVDEWSPR